jgi:hypothetical protein
MCDRKYLCFELAEDAFAFLELEKPFAHFTVDDEEWLFQGANLSGLTLEDDNNLVYLGPVDVGLEVYALAFHEESKTVNFAPDLILLSE